MFDATRATDHLRESARRGPDGPWPAGVPVRELQRSPAAAAVGRLAAEAGIFAFHFEHRAHLDLPVDWTDGDEDRAAAPTWTDGVLPERKYQSFRHDHAVASFHPGHRAKWGTHELCHALVGFAWRHDATPFFHATAARLSELLPVVLWYFLDEAFLRRCPDHAGGGALFRTLCPACERSAGVWLEDPDAQKHLADAAAFLDRELAAIARSRRLGRPVPHHHATLDLCSDGIAYARAHGARLQSDAHLHWMMRFAVHGGGWASDLDRLEARVVEVARAIVGEAELTPLAASAVQGRWRWTLQDVGARILQVWADTEGPAADGLLAITDRLAIGVDATRPEAPHTPATASVVCETVLREAMDAYRELAAEWELPEPAALFAVGYPLLDGFGVDTESLARGVASALPGTARLLGDALRQQVGAFAMQDVPARAGLGRRFATWLQPHGPVFAADLARFEAAIAHPLPGDGGVSAALGTAGATGPWRISEGVEVLTLTFDPNAVLDAARGGPQPEPAPVGIVIGQGAVGRVALQIPVEDAERLSTTRRLEDAGDATAAALRDAGLATPASWSERHQLRQP